MRQGIQRQLKRAQQPHCVEQECRKRVPRVANRAHEEHLAKPAGGARLEEQPAARVRVVAEAALQEVDPLWEGRLILCVAQGLDEKAAAKLQAAHRQGAVLRQLLQRQWLLHNRLAATLTDRSRCHGCGCSPGHGGTRVGSGLLGVRRRLRTGAHGARWIQWCVRSGRRQARQSTGDDAAHESKVRRVEDKSVAKELHVLRPHRAHDRLGHHRSSRLAQDGSAPTRLIVVVARVAAAALSGRGRFHFCCLRSCARHSGGGRVGGRLRKRRHALVKEHVGGVWLGDHPLGMLHLLGVPMHDGLDAAVARLRDVALVKGLHQGVVEVQPARAAAGQTALLDVRVVVAGVGGPRVDEHADELIELTGRARDGIFRGTVGRVSLRGGATAAAAAAAARRGARCRREVVHRVWAHVDRVRELKVVVELHLLHRLEVELEPLQVERQHRRQPIQAGALDRLDVLARVALVLVVAVEHLALDVRGEAVEDGALVLDLDRDGVEELLPLREEGARFGRVLRDDLAHGGAAKQALEQLATRGVAQRRLEALKEHVVEFVDVHLDRRADGLVLVVAPTRAELARVVKLFLRLAQVAEHRLDLVQEALVRLVAPFSAARAARRPRRSAAR